MVKILIDKRLALIFLLIIILAIIPSSMGIPMVTAQAPIVTARFTDTELPIDPLNELWKKQQLNEALLAGQQLVYPFSIDEEVRKIRFTALHNATHIAFYIEWDDKTKDIETPGSLDVFGDAVAIQFPVYNIDLPNICMGTVDNPVNIVFWKAGPGVENLVAGTGYGLSPEQREALGLQKIPTSPIEKLPNEAQIWIAEGIYRDGKWRVVMIRPLGSVYELVPTFKPGDSVSIVFAQWDGSKGERAGAKSTGGWMTLKLEDIGTVEERIEVETPIVTPVEELPLSTLIPIIVIGLGAVIGLIIAIALIMSERKQGK